MDEGDKLYLTNVFLKILDGRVVDADFYHHEENHVEVPALTLEMPDGQRLKLLIYKDDLEDAPGWLELAD